jgi:hypothetical protein
MNPPARPIRAELNDALVGGIRKRGPDTFGMVIEALARLVVGVLTFLVLFGLSKIAGYEATSVAPFAGMTGISGLVSWLVMRRPKDSGEGDEPSDDA